MQAVSWFLLAIIVVPRDVAPAVPSLSPSSRPNFYYQRNGVRVLPFLRRRVHRSLWFPCGKKKKGKKDETEGYLRWCARGETISRKCSRDVVLRSDAMVRRLLSLMHRFVLMATRDPLSGHSRFLRGEKRKRRGTCRNDAGTETARMVTVDPSITHNGDTCSSINKINCVSVQKEVVFCEFWCRGIRNVVIN